MNYLTIYELCSLCQTSYIGILISILVIMKILLLFYTSLFFSFSLIGQTTAIPDPNFEQALIDQGYDSGSIDGVVFTDSINTITVLNINNKGIFDLTGIEDFIALISLFCVQNQLSSIDFSQNTSLGGIDCRYNQLTNINVSNNTSLTHLDCVFNQLTSLDISNNTSLTSLSCAVNQITSLDLSQHTLLTDLSCSNNQLTSLNIPNSPVLTYLSCANNLLISLDVSNSPSLITMYCYNKECIFYVYNYIIMI